jgi:signal transduction histidine kinase
MSSFAKPLFFVRKHALLFQLIIISICLGSCRHFQDDDIDYPAQTEAILKNVPKGNDHEMEVYLDKAFKTFKPGPKDTWKKYDYLRRHYFYQEKDYYKADYYADSMIAAVHGYNRDIKYRYYQIKALIFKGDALFAINHFDEAFQLYDKIDKLIKQGVVGNLEQFDYAQRLANGFYRQGNYEQAVLFYKRSIDFQKLKNQDAFARFSIHQALLDNVGLCFSNLKNTDSAIYYFDAASNYIEKNRPAFKAQDAFLNSAIAVVYDNKAKVLLNTGKYNEAERLLRTGISINSKQLQVSEEAEDCREKLAKLYLRQHKTQLAQQLLDTIRLWINTKNNDKHRVNYYRLMADANTQTGNFEAADHFNRTYLRFTDSVADLKPTTVSGNLEKLIAYNERAEQLDDLQKDQNRSLIFLLVIVSFLLMALAVIFLIYRNYRQSSQNVKLLITLNEDATEKNRQLHEAMTALENSHQANNKMVRIVAHDIRNPIAAISSFMDLLKIGSIKAEEEQEVLDMLQASCRDAFSLIDDMLNNNISADDLVLADIDLEALLHYCAGQLSNKAKEKDQNIVLDLESVTIYADREKLWRLFSNLINNAIKFSEAGGEITISTKIADKNVLICIEDNGIGIPKAMHDKIFDIQSTIRRKGTAQEVSFGLGLYICKQIVNVHKGKIWFESDGQKGTAFYVLLPLNA